MDIRVSGRQVDVGDSLRSHIAERLEANVAHFFDGRLGATITINREGGDFGADCVVNAPRGVVMRSHALGGDAYSAFDKAAEKIEKQLRRYKRRLKNHHVEMGERERALEAAQAFVIAAEEGEDEGGESESPIIIAETRTGIPSVSVKDAVMLMNLADQAAFLFRNVRNDQMNVVYRRSDGNIGWVNPASDENS